MRKESRKGAGARGHVLARDRQNRCDDPGRVALGTLGGVVFHALALPLPWMLGALCLTMAAAVAGLPVRGPMRLRPAIVAVIGVLLGSRFTPEILAGAQAALLTLAILLVYLVAVAAVAVPWYRFAGRQDWTTAYCAGMPGGLTEMIELGEAKGADVPSIVLAHSLRIVLTIGLMAFAFRVVLGHDVAAARVRRVRADGPCRGLPMR